MRRIDIGSWRDAARAVKRALLPRAELTLCGRRYQVVYETRAAGEDRDYPALVEAARGLKCVFDVGANQGVTALLLRTAMAAEGRLFAFEASEFACRLIAQNMALNGCRDVEVVNALVASASGVTHDFHWDFASGGSSTIPGYLGHDNPMQKAAIALDDFAAQHALAPQLIKIDVEGAERSVLEGARGILESHRSLVFLELHGWTGTRLADNAHDILALIEPIQYRMLYLRTKQIVEDAQVLGDRGRCHVLLVPPGPQPSWLRRLDTSGL